MTAKRQAEAAEDFNVVAILQQATFPTPPEARRIIDRRAGNARQRLLVHHAFDKERRLREGLEALVNAANAAYVDLRRHDAALTAMARQHQAFDGRVAHVVENPVQKDLMAFCVAGLATVDVTRRLETARPELAEAMNTIVTENFANGVSEFIKKLRNNLAHGAVAIPGWVITKAEGIDGSMAFNLESLFSFGDWTERSRVYAKSKVKGDTLDVMDVCGDCAEVFSELKRKKPALSESFLAAEQISQVIEDHSPHQTHDINWEMAVQFATENLKWEKSTKEYWPRYLQAKKLQRQFDELQSKLGTGEHETLDALANWVKNEYPNWQRHELLEYLHYTLEDAKRWPDRRKQPH